MRKKILTLLVLFLCVVLIRPLFSQGFPDTHDGVNHLARIANYAVALKQGQIPPRIAPTFMAGYGYPVFNYNYPLANMLALPFLTLHISVETTLKIITVFGVLLGAYGVYDFLKRYVSRESSLFAVCAYLLAPFLFNNMYVRGVIGETLAYGIFPHVLLAAYLLFEKRNKKSVFYAALATSAFMLSHNIFVMFMAPLVLLYVAYLMVEKRRPILSYIPEIIVMAGGVISASFFWVPALLEQGFVNIALVNLTQFYNQHFVTLKQLLFAPFAYGLSYPGPTDTLSYNVGSLFLLSFLLGIAYVVGRRKHVKPLVLSLLGFVGFALLMLPLSLVIWNAIGVLHFTQFPWRLLGLVAVFGTALAAFVYEDSRHVMRWILTAVVFFMIVSISQITIDRFIHHDDLYYKTYAETSTVQHENQPATFTFVPIELASNTPVFDEGEILEKDIWNGSHHVYKIYSPKEETVTEETAYFPGWKAYVDDVEVPITYWNAEGKIQITIPEGVHDVETIFTQNTPARILGNSLTIIVFLVFCVYFFVPRKVQTKLQKLQLIVSVLFVWRTLLQILTIYASNLFIFDPSYPYYRPVLSKFGPAWMVRWAGFDGVHYLTIAVKGYLQTGNIQAFFPVYPYLVHFLTIGNEVLTGLLVSHVFTFLSMIMLYKLAALDSTWIRKHIGYLVLAVLTFPTAFYLISMYTESLFLFLVLLAFYNARKKRWIIATLLAVVVTATRITGVFLIPALMVEAYVQRENSTRLPIKTWVLLSLGSLGILSFMAFLWKNFNDPLYFFHVQKVFNPGRQETLVLFPQVVYRYIKIFLAVKPDSWMFYTYIHEFVATLLSLGVFVWMLIKRYIKKDESLWMVRGSYMVYALGSFFISPLTGTFTSMPRYILVLFPLLFLIAQLSSKHKKVYWAIIVVNAVLLCLNVMLFLQGRWIA